jgi:hypothetical protein
VQNEENVTLICKKSQIYYNPMDFIYLSLPMFHQQGTSTITARFGNGHVAHMVVITSLSKGHDLKPPYSISTKMDVRLMSPLQLTKKKPCISSYQ